QLQQRFLVGARNRPESATAAEHVAEKVFDVDAAAGTAEALAVAHPRAGGPCSAEATDATGTGAHPLFPVLGNLPEVFAESVVALAGFGIRQHVIGLIDLFEPFFGAWILVDIRVVLAGQRAERLLDLIGGRVPRHPE